MLFLANDLNVNETAFLIDTEIDWNNEERVIENLTMIALVGIQGNLTFGK